MEESFGIKEESEFYQKSGSNTAAILGIGADRESELPIIEKVQPSKNIPTPRSKLTTGSGAKASTGGIAASKAETNSGGTSDTRASDNFSQGGASTATSISAPNDDASSAQAQASADISRCQQAQSIATRCCNNPLSCASSADKAAIQQINSYGASGDSQGLTAYCQQMQGLGDSSGGINTRLGATCTSNHYACQNTCSSLVSKYQSLLASCNGECNSYSVYSSTISSLQSMGRSCEQLSARADALSMQGLSTASNSAYGDLCQQAASAVPQNMGMPTQNSFGGASGFAAQPGSSSYACQMNPNSPACVASIQQATAAAVARGQAGFKSNTTIKQEGFALADGYTSNASAYAGNERVQQYGSRQVDVPQVPNNSGGGLIGDGESSANSARLGPTRGSVAGSTAARGASTNIDQGYRSGGYSPPPAQDNNVFPMSYGQRQAPVRPAASADDDGGYRGMDLKQFLPGGSRDPGRRLAGSAAGQVQINAKEENIWRRISNKMYEKCKLGVLWRCN
ncbi:MAG: hypothetical protein KF799_01720 [Bdellovibrionales bacterium]|nr:hypothetical protein [Bdellovibrionales bacterium]